MRILLLLFLPVLVFSSCAKYQCVSISSENTGRNEKNEFEIDKDSLRVIFNFQGRRGTVQVTIFNGTAKIMGVNWAKSFVIVNESPSSFYNPEVHLTGELARTSYSQSVTMTGTAAQPQTIQYIPPQTQVSRTGLSLTESGFIDPGNYQFFEESVNVGGRPQKMKRARIEKTNSPLSFRIYLTLVPGDSADPNPMILERSFYVSELINTEAEAPEIFPKNQFGNMIIMKKSTGAGVLLKTTITFGLIALVCVAAGS